MIGIYISTKNMTKAMHDEGRRRLEEAGVDESAMKIHAVFGENGSLGVFDIWESQEAWESFLAQLIPVLQDIGIELNAPPDVVPIVALQP
jgi:hypothetical protein